MQKKGKSFKRKKYVAMALTLAGLCCYGTGPAMAEDNKIITDGSTGPYINGGTHDIRGYLILGDLSGYTGTYTITGDSAQTNVNFLPNGNNGAPNGALIVGNGGTGYFTQGTDTLTDPNNQVNVAGDLVLGQQTTSVGTYILNSGQLNVGGQVAVGGQSTNANSFTQYSGAVILDSSASSSPDDYVSVGTNAWTGALAVGGGTGSNSGGTGTYNLIGGTINTYNLLIGPTGTGTMTQTGGQVTTTYTQVGFSGTGTYNLQGDSSSTLSAYSEMVGYAGTGTFNQSGGVNSVATDLRVGVQYASNSIGQGTYNLTGGTLTTGNTFVGQGETGTFVLNDNDALGTTHTVNGNLILGALSIPANPGDSQTPGNGSYTITGNTSLNVNFVSGGNGPADPVGSNGYTDNYDSNNNYINTTANPAPNGALIVGEHANGTFTQGTAGGSDSPAVNVAGDLVLGSQAGSQGQYTLNTGDLTVGGKLVVGGASQNANLFTQNGGTVNITGSAPNPYVQDPNDPSKMIPNPNYVGVGNSYHTNELFIGGGGDGIIDGGSGTYIMNGGTLNAGAAIEVGHAGTGVMTQSGDSTVNAYFLWLGNAGGYNGNGTYNLSNGTLNVNSISVAMGASGTFNLNGGTINAGSIDIARAVDGTFNQTSGVNNISDLLDIGRESGQGTYNLSGGSVNAGRTTVGDGTADGSGMYWGSGGILNISGDASLTTGDLRVGVLNSGTVNHSGGTVTAGYLSLGEIGTIPNGSGYYNLTGTGQLSVSGDEIIGSAGYGKVTQGEIGDERLTSNTVAGNLKLGNFDNIHPNDGSQPRAGEYILNTGTLSTDNTIVGSIGVGTFTQNGGSHTVADTLIVGDQSQSSFTDPGGLLVGGPSEGTYTMNNGVLTAGNMVVGNFGNGTFAQNGGMINVTDTTATMYIGSEENSTGIYTLNAGTLDVKTSEEKIGGSGTGTFNQTGGTHNFTGAMYLGDTVTGSGQYNLSGGTLTAGEIVLGEWGGTGKFFQNGTSNVTTDNLVLARQKNATGFYQLDGGTLHVTSNEVVGGQGAGTFTQTGGNHTVDGMMTIGQFAEDLVNNFGQGVGIYNLQGGTLNDSLIIGDAGTGTFNNNGGTHNITGDLVLGNQSSGNGTYNLEPGGSLTVTETTIVGAAGTGAFNQTGGSFFTDWMDVGQTGSGTVTQSGGSTMVTNNLVIARNEGSTGAYTINADNTSLQAGAIQVGIHSDGTFTQSAGTVAASVLVLGYNNGSSEPGIGNGTYSLSNTGQLTISGSERIGLDGTGLFNQTGGTNTVGGDLIVGQNNGAKGTYELSGGNLNVTGSVTIQKYTGSTGELDMTGVGSALTAASLTNNGTFNYSAGTLTLGGGSGTLTNNTGATLNNTGTLSNSGTLKNFGTLNNYGTLDNSGTLNNNGLIAAGGTILNQSSGFLTGSGNIIGSVENYGTVNPGNSPGKLSITGSYTQSSLGTFVAELGRKYSRIITLCGILMIR